MCVHGRNRAHCHCTVSVPSWPKRRPLLLESREHQEKIDNTQGKAEWICSVISRILPLPPVNYGLNSCQIVMPFPHSLGAECKLPIKNALCRSYFKNCLEGITAVLLDFRTGTLVSSSVKLFYLFSSGNDAKSWMQSSHLLPCNLLYLGML